MLKTVTEHYNKREYSAKIDFEGHIPFDEDFSRQFTKRGKKVDCFRVYSDNVNKVHKLSNSYFVGVDWVVESKCAIYVEPKLNNTSNQTDYLTMLFEALRFPESLEHAEDLFQIDWESQPIEIPKQTDFLTPLIVAQYLMIIQRIVRKGLKKSYYRVEKNIFSKTKGKILVASTIKQNHVKNKVLNTVCVYDEFGLNSFENRLLKKALSYSNKCLMSYPSLKNNNSLNQVFAYASSAFQNVSEDVEGSEVKNFKSNIFYKEYNEATVLAKIILKKNSYNISNTSGSETVKTQPFWIDMSKLFELYVYSQLKQKYKEKVKFQFKGQGTFLDYLINTETEKIIVDAKYRTLYKDTYDIKDIRQISAYARERKVYEELEIPIEDRSQKIIKCLIIYPDQNKELDLWQNEEEAIEKYIEFYKRPVALPVLSKASN